MTGEIRRMIKADLPKVKSSYDVLMDGYTWYAGVHTLLAAEQLGWALLDDNPKAVVQVRKTEIATTIFTTFLGVPTDGDGIPL